LIRIPIPDLSEERRLELKKVAGRYAEQAKVAVRNVRRDGMDTLKQMERDGEISQDEQKSQSEDIQKLTDDHISKIDKALETKETEIMQV
jgi:ribosome recycling factor